MDRSAQLVSSDLNFAEALREWARNADGKVVDEDGISLMTAPHPHFVANNLFVSEPTLSAAEIMARGRNFFGPLGRSFAIQVPEHSCGSLATGLEQQGAMRVVSSPGMLLAERLADPELGPGVTLDLVRDQSGRRDFVTVARDAWSTYGIPEDGVELLFNEMVSVSRPHLHTAVAYIEGRPVAAAQVILSHGIAGIYWVSTASAARRRGLAEACTRLVGNVGFDLGAACVVLQASPMGEPIYRRMGYIEITRYAMLLVAAG